MTIIMKYAKLVLLVLILVLLAELIFLYFLQKKIDKNKQQLLVTYTDTLSADLDEYPHILSYGINHDYVALQVDNNWKIATYAQKKEFLEEVQNISTLRKRDCGYTVTEFPSIYVYISRAGIPQKVGEISYDGSVYIND